MPDDRSVEYVEVRFLIPIREDKNAGSGRTHPHIRWEYLQEELFNRFEGWTEDTALKRGAYIDPDTGERIADESREFRVAVTRRQLDEMRECLKTFARVFKQKFIYATFEGKVEFIKGC